MGKAAILVLEKPEVLEFFGDQKETAYALGLTYQAIDRWGETLSVHVSATVIVAGIRHKGVHATRRQWPEFFKRVGGSDDYVYQPTG